MTGIEELKDRLREKRMNELISELGRDTDAFPSICRRIENAFLGNEEDWKKQSSIISAKYKLEEMMRACDELTWLADGNEAADYPAQMTLPTDNYTISGNKEDGFEIRMPVLQKRGYDKKHHAQKVKAECVRAVSERYLEKMGIGKCVYDKCTLIYTVMIGPECAGNIGDSDNLDTKQITDALSGVFFIDDNLTHVELVIGAQQTDEPSYTSLKVLPRSEMRQK